VFLFLLGSFGGAKEMNKYIIFETAFKKQK